MDGREIRTNETRKGKNGGRQSIRVKAREKEQGCCTKQRVAKETDSKRRKRKGREQRFPV